jgi:molecular chaperone HtpG
VLSSLREYDGKQLTSIDSADLDLPPAKADVEPAKKDEGPVAGMERVLTLFRTALGDQVKEVRESARLTDSPCCLVSAEDGMSAQMQKIMRMANKDFPAPKRIFEVNPRSPLVRRLAALSANPEHDGFIQQCGAQLYANAMILEGLFPEPQNMVGRIQAFMETAADKLSPIIA